MNAETPTIADPYPSYRPTAWERILTRFAMSVTVSISITIPVGYAVQSDLFIDAYVQSSEVAMGVSMASVTPPSIEADPHVTYVIEEVNKLKAALGSINAKPAPNPFDQFDDPKPFEPTKTAKASVEDFEKQYGAWLVKESAPAKPAKPDKPAKATKPAYNRAGWDDSQLVDPPKPVKLSEPSAKAIKAAEKVNTKDLAGLVVRYRPICEATIACSNSTQDPKSCGDKYMEQVWKSFTYTKESTARQEQDLARIKAGTFQCP